MNISNKLRSVSELPHQYQHVFSDFQYFNSIQSHMLDDILNADSPIVVSAPTGSGKTALFELAIIRLLEKCQNEESQIINQKIVYMAPVKALCSERYNDWESKFQSLGLKAIEVTGDSDEGNLLAIQHFNLVLTTPEKWDSLTRKWRDHTSLVSVIKLFFIDEVHLLNEDKRGSTLEAVVSRMKTVQESSPFTTHIRFIALSATIPNIEDVATWLGKKSEPAKYFKFGEETRPVRLKKIVKAFPFGGNMSYFKFDLSLSYKLKPLILEYSEGKPTLIFCNTRKSVLQTSATLLQNITFHFTPVQKMTLNQARASIQDSKLRDMVQYGVGFHHAGLLASDRHNIEELFRSGFLPVLICTSTLAMGVNLPAHLVVIKSTAHYVNGSWEEYSEGQILQMIGRAGRPQFDTTAIAVILTKTPHKEKYEKLMMGNERVESSLHKNLAEHLNSEIVLRTITDVAVAVHWIRSTFLYVRALKNPRYYGIPDGLSTPEIEARLQALCLRELNGLEKYEIIKKTDFAYNVEPTENGKLMARLYIAFETMKIFMKVKGTENLAQILELICMCQEFNDFQLRVNERTPLNLLNNAKNKEAIRFHLEGRIKTKEMKVNCLLQASLGFLHIADASLAQEANKIVRVSERIAKALSLYLWQKDFFQALESSLIIAKCLNARMWENSIYLTRQLPGIGPAMASLLATAKKTTFKSIIDSNPRDLERILNKHPPAGNNLQEAARSFPTYDLKLTYGQFSRKLYITVELLNADSVSNINQTTSLLVGDPNNKLLHKEKIRDRRLIENNGKNDFTVFIPPETTFIVAHLISDTIVGVDIKKSLSLVKGSDQCSDETASKEYIYPEDFYDDMSPQMENSSTSLNENFGRSRKKTTNQPANIKKKFKGEDKLQTNLHQYAFAPLRGKKLRHDEVEKMDCSESEVSSTQDILNQTNMNSNCTLSARETKLDRKIQLDKKYQGYIPAKSQCRTLNNENRCAPNTNQKNNPCYESKYSKKSLEENMNSSKILYSIDLESGNSKNSHVQQNGGNRYQPQSFQKNTFIRNNSPKEMTLQNNLKHIAVDNKSYNSAQSVPSESCVVLEGDATFSEYKNNPNEAHFKYIQFIGNKNKPDAHSFEYPMNNTMENNCEKSDLKVSNSCLDSSPSQRGIGSVDKTYFQNPMCAKTTHICTHNDSINYPLGNKILLKEREETNEGRSDPRMREPLNISPTEFLQEYKLARNCSRLETIFNKLQPIFMPHDCVNEEKIKDVQSDSTPQLPLSSFQKSKTDSPNIQDSLTQKENKFNDSSKFLSAPELPDICPEDNNQQSSESENNKKGEQNFSTCRKEEIILSVFSIKENKPSDVIAEIVPDCVIEDGIHLEESSKGPIIGKALISYSTNTNYSSSFHISSVKSVKVDKEEYQSTSRNLKNNENESSLNNQTVNDSSSNISSFKINSCPQGEKNLSSPAKEDDSGGNKLMKEKYNLNEIQDENHSKNSSYDSWLDDVENSDDNFADEVPFSIRPKASTNKTVRNQPEPGNTSISELDDLFFDSPDECEIKNVDPYSNQSLKDQSSIIASSSDGKVETFQNNLDTNNGNKFCFSRSVSTNKRQLNQDNIFRSQDCSAFFIDNPNPNESHVAMQYASQNDSALGQKLLRSDYGDPFAPIHNSVTAKEIVENHDKLSASMSQFQDSYESHYNLHNNLDFQAECNPKNKFKHKIDSQEMRYSSDPDVQYEEYINDRNKIQKHTFERGEKSGINYSSYLRNKEAVNTVKNYYPVQRSVPHYPQYLCNTAVRAASEQMFTVYNSNNHNTYDQCTGAMNSQQVSRKGSPSTTLFHIDNNQPQSVETYKKYLSEKAQLLPQERNKGSKKIKKEKRDHYDSAYTRLANLANNKRLEPPYCSAFTSPLPTPQGGVTVIRPQPQAFGFSSPSNQILTNFSYMEPSPFPHQTFYPAPVFQDNMKPFSIFSQTPECNYQMKNFFSDQSRIPFNTYNNIQSVPVTSNFCRSHIQELKERPNLSSQIFRPISISQGNSSNGEEDENTDMSEDEEVSSYSQKARNSHDILSSPSPPLSGEYFEKAIYPEKSTEVLSNYFPTNNQLYKRKSPLHLK